ncbi:threonine ammonia-lyase, biosynthetic [Paraneptunicella aestuarii]|uniref:threonine ammonia-lyase, biosynthetic n=1 Tax=Paraneptunicella aestuarii TaxID=2831148 RepID=UPI001E465898|nr:threonine ammonia-lyase, biosynthetic [Paraneptunicella aestuarii]UAA38948.1 threonine ammonia-lyase, biosynthetic [Paraneptunicella aestuarii]
MSNVTEFEYLQKILRSPVYDVAVNSDFVKLNRFSESMGNEVWLKREDQQPVKSFKLRGAYNRISQLSQAQLDAGVVAASAGNHAQGVAYSAARKGIKATIVMPETTPDIKVEAVRNFGGDNVKIVLFGSNFDAANAKAYELAKEQGLTMIPPFDNDDVIAGQGTIGKEILEKNPDLDILFIAVGGGGLAAGIATYVKAIRPDIKVVAVEAEDSACLKAALEAGQPVDLPSVGIFADGVAVKRIGEEPFRLCQQYVDEVITVNSDEICAAIKDIFDDTRVIAEPAGALSIAAIRKYVRENDIKGKKLAGILCGANINFHTLRYVSERCELGEQKEAVFAVKIPEQKGSFKKFCKILGGRSITEFNYRFASDRNAHVFVGIKLREGLSEFKQLTDALEANGYQWFDLSNNEIAKLHVRYMVGGRPPTLLNEHIYSFEFPESPGALLRFLETLGDRWNITLFHYRNHGAAQGLVLAGFDIPDLDQQEFNQYLEKLSGYLYQEQTDNPAYKFFLSDLNGVF